MESKDSKIDSAFAGMIDGMANLQKTMNSHVDLYNGKDQYLSIILGIFCTFECSYAPHYTVPPPFQKTMATSHT
jgi:hypothetical protein